MASALSVAALASGCAGAALGARSAQTRTGAVRQASIKLRILPQRPQYGPNDPIVVRFELANRGPSAVYVNKRCAVNPQALPEQAREIVLEVVGPDALPVACDAAHPTGLPKTDDYYWLEPGQAVACNAAIDLRQSCRFASPGVHRVVAVYRNVMGGELGLTVFQGSARAEPVSITVAE